MQEPREFLGALFESVKTSMRTPIVVDLIAARDAEIRRECAERAVKWLLDGFASEWLSDDAESTLRAAIIGEEE